MDEGMTSTSNETRSSIVCENPETAPEYVMFMNRPQSDTYEPVYELTNVTQADIDADATEN